MNKRLCGSALCGILLFLSACTWPSSNNPVPTQALSLAPALSLVVQVQNPTAIFDSLGDVVNYTYIVTNTGTQSLAGPVNVSDNIATVTCLPVNTIGNQNDAFDPGESISCSGTYGITQTDLDAHAVTNIAIANAAGGSVVSAPVGATVNLSAPTAAVQATATASAPITNGLIQGSVTPGPSNLARGSTIQHQVVKGEWLFQIARCYGVEYKNLRNANLQIANPSEIDPGQIVTVPNIGSVGTIYGPPCVVYYTVVAGDTWNSIAARYNARLDVLQAVNPNGLVSGAQIKVPINSAGAGAAPIPVTGVTPTFTATVTSTPSPTPTGGTAIAGAPIRITIPAGSTSTSISGSLVSHETVNYVVAAIQGQTMTVTLAAPANEIAMRIFNPGGILIKPLDGNLTWTGILAASGDYFIDLVGLTDPTKNYILTVTITGP